LLPFQRRIVGRCVHLLISISISDVIDEITNQIFEIIDAFMSLLKSSVLILALKASQFRCILQVSDKCHNQPRAV